MGRMAYLPFKRIEYIARHMSNDLLAVGKRLDGGRQKIKRRSPKDYTTFVKQSTDSDSHTLRMGSISS